MDGVEGMKVLNHSIGLRGVHSDSACERRNLAEID